MNKTITIHAKRDKSMIWCYAPQYPDVYGYYKSEGEAEVDLRYQIKIALMEQKQEVPEENIKIHFEYE